MIGFNWESLETLTDQLTYLTFESTLLIESTSVSDDLMASELFTEIRLELIIEPESTPWVNLL